MAPGVPMAYPTRPRTGTIATGARIAELAVIVLGLILTTFADLTFYNGHIGANSPLGWFLDYGLEILVDVVTGALAIVAAFTGLARMGLRWGSAALAAGSVVLSLVVSLLPYALFNNVTVYDGVYFSVLALADLALVASWALGRPFRGLGYIVIGVTIILEIVRAALDPLFGNTSVTVYLTLVAVTYIVGVLIVVGLGVLLERRRS
jgi:hypothetical protein